MLQRVAVCCSVLQCVTVCYSVLQCVAVYCSVLQRIAVRCSILQRAAACCSVLQWIRTSSLSCDQAHSKSKDFQISNFHSLHVVSVERVVFKDVCACAAVSCCSALMQCVVAERYICYGVATISRILKMIGLFCKRAL